MHVINKKTQDVFRENIESKQEFDDLVLFTKENDSSGIVLELVGYKEVLIKRAAELFAYKFSLADYAILKEKAPLAPVYDRKYEKAMAGGFSEEERQAIIKNHVAQMQAKDYYMELLDLAYQGVTAMLDSGQLVEAEQALEKFAGFDETATAEDIKAVIAV